MIATVVVGDAVVVAAGQVDAAALTCCYCVAAGRVVAAKIVHIVAGNIVSARCIAVGKFVVDVQHNAAVIVVAGTGVQ
jgi:hypothetical protein